MDQRDDDQESDQGQSDFRRLEAAQTDQGGIIVDDDTGIYKTDKSYKETDTAGNTEFQVFGNTVDDLFTDLEEGHDDENDTFYKDSGQRDPESAFGASQFAQTYCIGKVSVYTKSCRKSDRIVGI